MWCDCVDCGTRGCTTASHWMERDSYDTGKRNHMQRHTHDREVFEGMPFVYTGNKRGRSFAQKTLTRPPGACSLPSGLSGALLLSASILSEGAQPYICAERVFKLKRHAPDSSGDQTGPPSLCTSPVLSCTSISPTSVYQSASSSYAKMYDVNEAARNLSTAGHAFQLKAEPQVMHVSSSSSTASFSRRLHQDIPPALNGGNFWGNLPHTGPHHVGSTQVGSTVRHRQEDARSLPTITSPEISAVQALMELKNCCTESEKTPLT